MLRHGQSNQWQFPASFFFIVCLLGFPALVAAQAKEEQAKSNVPDQKEKVPKSEGEVRSALREIQRLSAGGLTTSSTAKAIVRLQNTLAQVNDDTDLSPERRKALERMLKDRIRVLQTTPSGEEDKQSRETKGSTEED